jgi:hypothetical protein
VGVIDGDSLLELLLTHKLTLLDWSFGGQPLHLVELFERFLQQFVLRNVKMQLVFFSEAAWLWRASPSKLFARAVLIDHLKTRATSHLLEVVQYESFSCRAWISALAELDPNWILCFDSSLVEGQDAVQYFDALVNHHIMTMRCNVVMVPGLEFRGNDVDAWVKLERGANYPDSPTGAWSSFAPTKSVAAQVAEEAVKKAAAEIDSAIGKAVEACFASFSSLPLSARAVALTPNTPDSAVVRALDTFYAKLLPFAGAALIDVVDGRFLHHVLRNKIDVAALVKSSHQGEAPSAAPVAASVSVVTAVAPEVVAPAPAALEAVDSGPADSWADFDLSSINIPGVDDVKSEVAAPAPVAAAVVSASPSSSSKKSLPPVAQRLGKDVQLGEPKKKGEKKSKREMKGEQRAAHMEKLQADSLLGRYVQQHVITLDKKQVKMSSKVAKAKETAAINERAKQEDNWKNWLQVEKKKRSGCGFAKGFFFFFFFFTFLPVQ